MSQSEQKNNIHCIDMSFCAQNSDSIWFCILMDDITAKSYYEQIHI